MAKVREKLAGYSKNGSIMLKSQKGFQLWKTYRCSSSSSSSFINIP
jgi:hypothetical protein